jgi:flagellar basal-body rod protein FlgB
MDLTASPYFSVLRARIGVASERQKVIAENIANVSTPGYVARDLDMKRFESRLSAAADQAGGGAGVRMTRTNAGHMPAGGS